MKKLIVFFVVAFAIIGCPEVEQVTETTGDAVVASALMRGEIVTVTEFDEGFSEIEINGIYVGDMDVTVSREPISFGCFGIPTCVALTESNRGVVRKAVDDIAIYDDFATGTTYFMTDFFEPYWRAPNATAMNALLMASEYRGKRNAFCLLFPSRCEDLEI